MAVMRKAMVYLGLVEDDHEQYDEYEEYEAPAPSSRRGAPEPAEMDYRRPGGAEGRDRAATYPRSGALTNGATAVAVAPSRMGWADSPAGAVRVTTLHPRTYNEARAIGEHFREGTPVIMNLTEMDDADAKRLVDFAAGLIFGLRGSIERVTAKVFLLSPQNVEVTAEDKQRIAEGGFFNQS
ncbi:MAG: cell division inhibitor SepF [Actinomycetota bacterium]|jgi:cell division inhibitor SepF|nr:cell division inhibitor SepF [Actinomycetota bacterium]